ncbi:MAG: hypothetical protein ABSA21_10995 [Candidatus Limnocylindrales bacterium]|jgi:hypothetical protein
MSAKDQPPKAVRIDSWGFEIDRAGTRRRVSLLGVFLIVVGLLLAAGQLVKGAQIGASAIFLALGIIFLVAGLRDRNDLALYAGLFISALALSNLLTEAGLISGGGWGTLFLGVGVLALVPIRASSGRSWGWAAVIGGLLVLWGGSDVATSYLNVDTDRLVGPLLLVLLGVWILTRSRRSR